MRACVTDEVDLYGVRDRAAPWPRTGDSPFRQGQYASIRYSGPLAKVSIEPSIGNRGDIYDIALAETIDGVYKADRFIVSRREKHVSLPTLE
ncbi:hypothetical protein C7413_1511 [Paraburkholderia silvatlantica]|nr:hypothetical protein C7411_1471 [Paraburkholderia silvatlantica]PXW23773.1 hypothetical protein C7413_1511 [Paraburkholderia silvatlantica]TDQ98945.1 hypothetical protein C7412_104162 [Paraburkholderia silvatlantica]